MNRAYSGGVLPGRVKRDKDPTREGNGSSVQLLPVLFNVHSLESFLNRIYKEILSKKRNFFLTSLPLISALSWRLKYSETDGFLETVDISRVMGGQTICYIGAQ